MPSPTPIPEPTSTPVIIVIPPLNAPELDVSVSGTSLTLTWEEVSEADRYEVQEDRSGWGTVRRTTGLTATFSGLTVGRAYTYRVCSYRGIDRLTVCSGGQTWSIDPTPRPTATPVPLTAPVLSSEAEPGVIRLTWTRVSNAEGYDVQLYTYSCQGRSASEQSERCTLWWWKTIGNDLTGLNEDVRNLAEGRSHTFRVCAFIGVRQACSNERSEIFVPDTPPPTETPTPTATATPTPTLPLPPVVPDFEADGTFVGVSLTWTRLTGIQGYKITYSTGGSPVGPGSRVEYPSATDTSFDLALTCDDIGSRRFEISARGDGVTYRDGYGPTDDETTSRKACPEFTVTSDGDPFQSLDVQKRVAVLETVTLRVKVEWRHYSDYRFRLVTHPSKTGFYTPSGFGGCSHGLGDATISRGATPILGSSRWGDFYVRLIRCGLGSLSETSLEVQAERNDGTGDVISVYLPGRASQSWHQDARSATYKIVGGDQTLENGVDAGVKMWNDRIGGYFTEMTGSSPSVKITYADVMPLSCGIITDPMACVNDGDGPFPHYGTGDRTMWVRTEPIEGGRWVNSLDRIENPFFDRYLPEVVAHELGHVMGLGHLPASANALMRAEYDTDKRKRIQAPTAFDMSGFDIVNGSHPH